MRAAVLVPLKDFRSAKGRLARVLDEAARRDLARRMAAGVLAAAHPLPAFVVCDDDEVARFTVAHGATVLWEAAGGLDAAVTLGVEALRSLGIERAVVVHGDLPLARSLAGYATGEGVTLVPDRRDDGTNVASVPTGAGYRFSYGPGSFRRHGAEALRLGLRLRVVRDRELGWDVDLPEDLAAVRATLGA